MISSEVSFLRSNFFLTEPHLKASETKNQTLVSDSLLTSLHLHGPADHDPSAASDPDSSIRVFWAAGEGWGAGSRVPPSPAPILFGLICDLPVWGSHTGPHSSQWILYFKIITCFHTGQRIEVHIKRGLPSGASEAPSLWVCASLNPSLVCD